MDNLFINLLFLIAFLAILVVWLYKAKASLNKSIEQSHSDSNKYLLEGFTNIQNSISQSLYNIVQQNNLTLNQQTKDINDRIERLTSTVESRLSQISKEVEQRLATGFDKTSETFNNILKRLALIDSAQKHLSDLSSDVVSLQQILTDKRSRGAFGEVQLNNLIRNILPEQHFSLQHTMSTGAKADCLLFLPEPTGNLVIDSKFPLENYHKTTSFNASKIERKDAEAKFKQDVKKHINDIASKYIIPNETGNGAIMFIPAEAVFAEIHAHHPELVNYGYSRNIWLASPTTMMAVLTTAMGVIKDHSTKKHIKIIQQHLSMLSKDFERFNTRMQKLSRHVQQANDDVKQVTTSAEKITKRFTQIEQAEIPMIEDD